MKDSARCISENFTATSHYAGLCITLEMQNADVDKDKELCKEHSWLNRQRAPWRKFRAPKLKQKNFYLVNMPLIDFVHAQLMQR